MKTKYFIFAAAAALFAACSSDDAIVEQQVPQTTVDDGAIQFGAYVNRGLTRAGVNGVLNTENLKDDTKGFGVFGYYTDGERYSGITKPNFFYNQQVTYKSTNPASWTYTPLKYWPNEFGSDAISDQVDRLTFFAYAPYVKVNPLTGTAEDDETTATIDEATTNIIGMSRNNVTGDPYIKYVATMDASNSVDLCYGVAAEDFTSSNSALNQNNIKKGDPYIDVVKPGLDANSKIKFDFKHATAQLKVTVDAVVNAAEAPSTEDVQKDYTRIWVRSVTFEGITEKGALNLNGGEWYDVNGTNKISSGSLALFDGRKDGKEAILAATNEAPSSINPDLIQSVAYTIDDDGKITAPTTTGVTKDAVNLFKGATDAPVFVIPTGEKMKVTIVYDVETVDKNLAYYLSDGATQGSTVENSISKTIETFGNITAGYCYTLKLHLGMRTVDFDAIVTAWQDMEAPVDLPSNLQSFAATNPETTSKVTLPAGDGDFTYKFAITGLNINENVTVSAPSTDWVTGHTQDHANGAGIATQSVNVKQNTTTKNRQVAGYTRWKGASSNKTAAILFIQQAAPLGLSVTSWTDNKTINLSSTATSGLTDDLTKDGTHIKVWKNDVALIYGTDFTYDSKIITLTDEATTGDNYKVLIQSGDAPAESVAFKYPLN